MPANTKLVVRAAQESDISQLCKLYFEFHEYYVQGVPDRLVSPGRLEHFDSSALCAKLKEILRQDDAVIFVAELDGDCIGLAEAYIREDEPNPAKVSRKYCHLQSLMVSEEHRRAGVGTRLLEAAERYAKKHAAVEMRLDTWEFPGDPVDFYHRRGYRTLRRTLVRSFGS
jgi:GNAT superfamily N-acetyltransferase